MFSAGGHALPRLPTFVAFLAAIMLVIAGAPSRAAADPCNPCPPDCPMMKQMAAAADSHGKAPDKGGNPDNPCKQSAVCQASVTAPTASATVTFAMLTSALVDHGAGEELATPSRPPDRSLRPPIQL